MRRANRTTHLTTGSFLAMLALGSCIAVAQTRVQVHSPPAEGTPAMKILASNNNAFATDLYGHLDSGDGNLFFSPYSISSAMAMVYAGARGQTAAQIAKTLHFSLPADQLHPAFGDLSHRLNLEGTIEGKQYFALIVANALWGQKGLPYQKSYLDLLTTDYGAALHETNFSGNPEQSRKDINTWVAAQTKDRIKDLIAPGAILPDTRLVLTNAIYFKSAWENQFKKPQTKSEPFQLGAGKTMPAGLMHQRHRFSYMENDDLQAVELPYKGDLLSMVVLLPRKVEGLPAVEKNLSSDNLDKWMGQLQSRDVDVFLPKFKATCAFELSGVLKEMGMPDAFGSNADFSGMLATEKIAIGQVIHKAFVEVDEEGTEAAAATAIEMRSLSMAGGRMEPVVFRADHPFIYIIRNRDSGAILFAGRVSEPNN